MRQLLLPLPAAPSMRVEDIIEDPSNAAALTWLGKPETWPLGRLALFGEAGTGKTHLARAAAARFGWRWLEGSSLRGLPGPAVQGSVLDDADCVPEETSLLHLINLCAERGETLLLIGRKAPARWPTRLPDLASRLRATQAVEVAPPSDALLRGLLAKLFADRQLRVDAELQAWLLARLPRDARSLAEAVARLDRAALLSGGRLSRSMARMVLGSWDAFDGFDEISKTEPRATSSSPTPLI
ncbi:MAG: hypothetical protein RIS83_2468 [Pseudomonadota bacterium]